ncbi:transporter substrate-binding domain-containing protein [Aliarcobacter butzleri]|uniref:Transporter substrate-binding domain-containing protein n=1 Tax=Aliarcobacter butzleri TaxID=28197 RepID=A0AAW7PYS2_9BACT|nr:transporter substrate-binding domain-containing protein [Aliarcobacter butzleri]MDN5071184.1 transporter substrate-binding domain-containing protein [Aliarcobacter butzleri]
MKKSLFYLILILLSTFLNANEKVVLQLKWFHQFQFAGYYAAKEKGFYDEVGLDVQIKERDLKYNNIDEVINGNAQYGVADSILILYRLKQQPIVIVSPIFQHSPSVFISLKKNNISSVYELNNKDILFYPNDTDGFSLLAMIKKFDLNVNLIRERHKDDYVKLINNEVDLMPAYIANEPFLLKEKGYDVNIINPSNYGFDIYGDMLFTNEDEAKNNPNRVEKFRDATLKGWKYALENKEEIIQLINEKYSKEKSIEHLKYEANAIDSLINKDITPLGYLDEGRIRYTSEMYKYYGLTESKIDLNDFLFDEISKKDKKILLSDEEIKYLKDNPILKVHNLDSLPPFNFNINNYPKGFVIDYMQLVGKSLGVQVEFIQNKTWKESFEMLKNNELDILPSIAINEERKKTIDFTNFSLVNFQMSLGVNKQSNIKTLDDLKNKKVSLVENSFLEDILKKEYPNIRLYITKNAIEAIDAVASNKVDAVIHNLSTIEYFINKNWLSNLKTIVIKDDKIQTITPLHLGVKKDNLILKSILEKTNQNISEKEIRNLVDKWLKNDFFEELKLTQTEYDYLSKKKKINYCISSNLMPIEKIDDNNISGITSDYINIFRDKINVNFNQIEIKSTDEGFNKLSTKKCDLVTFVKKLENTNNLFNFSNSHLSFPLVLVTKLDKSFVSSLKSLSGKKIAYVDENYKEMIIKSYPEIEFVKVNSLKEGLQKLKDEQFFGLVEILPVVGHEIQRDFSNSLKISKEIFSTINFSMAISKDDLILNGIINKLLNSISNENKNKIINNWTSINYEKNINYEKILIVGIILLVIIFIISLKNRQINNLNNQMKKYIKIVDENVLTSSTDLDGNITYVSEAFCEISGYTKDELIGQNHRIIRHPDMLDATYKDLWETISSGETWKGEIKNKKINGDYYWVKASISPIYDNKQTIIGYTAIRQDITDKKRIEEISITDGLTNIYNRRYFDEVFPKIINSAKRKNELIAFLFMDIDHFKQYNDNYGHQKGDDVLIKFAKCLKDSLHRSSDLAFRLGGEEFAIVYQPETKEKAIEFANTIKNNIEKLQIKHEFSSVRLYITASMGLVCKNANDIDDKIYTQADALLYEAKKSGRNQVKVNE